jgi:hypothetical protein
MYFLNGNHIYIKPENGKATPEVQLKSCLNQLAGIHSSKQVFKVNFFVDRDLFAASEDFRMSMNEKITGFLGQPIMLSYISQPPLESRVIAEVSFYDPAIWKATYVSRSLGKAVLFERDTTRFLIGFVQSCNPGSLRSQAEESFMAMRELLALQKFPVGSVIRQWNYIEDILGVEEGKQHYQEFNDVRAGFYGNAFASSGYPAATGIGTSGGGIMLEFIAMDSEQAVTKALNNPNQVAAHQYSPEVLVGKANSHKSTPRFERARYLETFGKKMIFISGTAAIVGEHTTGINHPAEQTKATIRNIQQLYAKKVLEDINGSLYPKYGHARVYIKKTEDFASIQRMCKRYYGDLPIVYLIADICRDELLVEIEGEVILE